MAFALTLLNSLLTLPFAKFWVNGLHHAKLILVKQVNDFSV
jgi:hypothetical protein